MTFSLVASTGATLALLLGPPAFAAGTPLSFAAPQNLGLADDSVRDAVVGDFNEDGTPDVVFAMSGALGGDSSVFLCLGGPAGACLGNADVPMINVAAVAAGDFNQDGHLDLAGLRNNTFSPAAVDLVYGDGAGGLGFGPSFVVFGSSFFSSGIAAADLDEDGLTDLAATGDGGNNGIFVTWLGTGGGSFSFGQQIVTPVAGSIEVADLNGDGHVDLDLGSSVELGAGDGSFTNLAGLGFSSRVLVPLDNDPYPDMLATGGSSVVAYLGQGDGSFLFHSLVSLGATGRAVAAGDLDGDGQQDAVVALAGGGFATALGDGSGALCAGPVIATHSNTDPVIVASDWSGDGLADVLVPYEVAQQAAVQAFLNTTTPSPWTDLGSGLAGASGTPLLAGQGSLLAGSTGSLDLSGAAPLAPCVLFLSFSSQPAPFKGGTLLTLPPAASIDLLTDAGGGLGLPFTWPAGIPTGATLYAQYAIADAGAVKGAALSNGVRATQP